MLRLLADVSVSVHVVDPDAAVPQRAVSSAPASHNDPVETTRSPVMGSTDNDFAITEPDQRAGSNVAM